MGKNTYAPPKTPKHENHTISAVKTITQSSHARCGGINLPIPYAVTETRNNPQRNQKCKRGGSGRKGNPSREPIGLLTESPANSFAPKKIHVQRKRGQISLVIRLRKNDNKGRDIAEKKK